MRRTLASLSAALFGLLAPTYVFAATTLERLNKVGETAFPGQQSRTAPQVAGQLIQFFISILGILFVVLMAYGGYLWMNARGNEQQVEKAKSLITQAVIGLAVVLAGYAITYFVVSNLVNATGYTGGAPAATP